MVTATAVAGNRLTVHGERFLVCHDTNHGPVGPGMSGIPVVLSQGTHRETVARVDAHGARGAFTVFVRVPAGFHAGPANVSALDTHASVVLP